MTAFVENRKKNMSEGEICDHFDGCGSIGSVASGWIKNVLGIYFSNTLPINRRNSFHHVLFEYV